MFFSGEVFPTFGGSNKYCCPRKIVNGITYILTDQTVYPDPACFNDCIYYVEDNPSNLVCFKNGPYEPECIPENLASPCPGAPGWIYYETKCYKVFFGSSVITWMNALEKCRQQAVSTIIIHN